MRILISGSSGLVGTALVDALRRDGHTVQRLVRESTQTKGGPKGHDVRWDPVAGAFDREAAEGADAVVHLAGASIAQGRWNDARKRLLRSSRVEATRHLVGELSRLNARPKVMVSASAIGYYGNRGDEILAESSPPGGDFLARLACDWEAESFRAEQLGIRAVALRFGVILSSEGGALARMLPPFRLGLGGRLGSGGQWMSWITLPEAVSLIRYALENAQLRGPLNAVAPNAVRNAEFTAILGRVLRRPTLFPVPPFALRLALGEMAEALLLSSQRVAPEKLMALGYSFLHPDLEEALRVVLGRTT